MKYDLNVILENIQEFQELRNSQRKYKGPLSEYKKRTIGDFISDYRGKGLRGKGNGVYDKLFKLIAPEEYKIECEIHVEDNKVLPVKPERYSIGDLLSHNERVIPYVSNIHQSVGKMMDVAINQAIEILENHSTSTSVKYGKVLNYFFIDHKSFDDIAKTINDSGSNVRDNIIKKFMKGEFFYAGICLSDTFKQKIVTLMDSLLFQACDTVFEENDIDTQEKIEFAKTLAGRDILDNMKEWGNVLVLTKDSYKNVTRQHLKSLKKALCDAIVPINISSLIERTKSDFVTKNEASEFNEQIIESFVKSHPWIQTDDEGRYYLLTRHLELPYQRQGRIIYEAGGPIHHNRVREIYKTIYGEDYKTSGIQSSLSKRTEHDFFPYGKSGVWYYSEDSKQIKLAGKVIAKFVDEHICFYWKDLSVVVTQLCKINKKYNKRRIRMEVTNLCYVDNNDKDHFVKKGEEVNYPLFLWSRPKQNRTNWCVNHAYEMLKESPNGEMKWVDFENQFKQDLQETGRPVKVIDDIKYIHSGSVNEDNKNDEDHVFIRENDVIRINEDVIQNKYNGDLSMYGLYRKYPEFHNDILSLAMTELRKQQDNKMLLIDFISLTLDNIESEGKIDAKYIRRIFNNNDNLPQGLSRYNDNGSVYIKYDPIIVEEDTKDDLQYVITTLPSDEIQTTPQVIVSEESRQPVTYATRFNWDDVKKALKSDLAFYDSPLWYQGITSNQVLDKFVKVLSSSSNYNLNDLVPQIIYEFHYARIDRYDHYQYLRNLPVAFEALLRDIYESSHRPIKTPGIKSLCENGFTAFDEALTNHEKKGFGRILNDLVYKRNKLLHGENLELSPVTLVQNIVEYLALFVYTVSKYALDV